jgi:hypothetical protein
MYMKKFYTSLSTVIVAISFNLQIAHASPVTLLTNDTSASASQTSTSIALQKLTWLGGSWNASNEKQTIDEHWSLQGESLLGISRTMEAGKSKAFELLLIEKQGDDFVLRLRFFGPSIDKATRGKEEPLRLKVVQADEQGLRCEGIDSETGTTLIYTKLSANTMQAQISKVREGKTVWQESYQFRRSAQ